MAFTYISAQNVLLTNNGEDPISSNLNPLDPQVAKTKNIIDRVTEQELLKGHNFNIQEKTLIPNVDGEISIADSSFLHIFLPYSVTDTVTTRNGILWDRTNDRAYAQSIKVLAYLNISFDSMPVIFRQYVAYEAALEYLSAYGSGLGSPQWVSVKRKRDEMLMAAYNSEYHSVDNAPVLARLYQWGGSVGVN